MAITVYLDDIASDVTVGTETKQVANLGTTGAIGFAQCSVATVLGPTAGLQLRDGASNPLTWFTEPLEAVTISGTITFNIWGNESSMNANAGFQVKVERCDGSGNVISTIVNSERGTEMSTTDAVNTWTATPTSTTLAAGDRLKFTVYANDAGGTMASGFTVNMFYSNNATNDISSVAFTETLAAAPSGLTVQAVPASMTLSALGNVTEIAASVASLAASASAEIQAVATGRGTVTLSASGGVIESASSVGSLTLSALAALGGGAPLILTSPSSLITLSAVASAQEAASGVGTLAVSSPATGQAVVTSTASISLAALASVQEAPRAVASLGLSAPASASSTLSAPAALLSLSSSASAQEVVSGSGSITLSGVGAVSEVAQSVSTLTLSAQAATSMPVVVFAPAGSMLLSAVASASDVLSSTASMAMQALGRVVASAQAPSGSLLMSALASSALSASGRGTVSMSASAGVNEVLTTSPGTIIMSAAAFLPGFPLQVQSPASTMTLSGVASVSSQVQALPAGITLSAGGRLSEISSSVASMSLSSPASVSLVSTGRASIALGAVASAYESATTIPATITLSASAAIISGQAPFTGIRPVLETAVRTGPSTTDVSKSELPVTISPDGAPSLESVVGS